MVKNAPVGDGRRQGAVKRRSQTFNPLTKKMGEAQCRNRKIYGC